MNQLTLETRVATLEQQMAELRERTNGFRHKPWLRSLGMFAQDDGMKEIFDEAMKLREKDRKRARQQRSKKASTRQPKK